jgi:dTDP-D-glucose 4,6-dehydratase
VVVRGNNVYGPRQYPEKLIPKFITLLNENKKCTIHGEGKTIRNFIHVDDVSSAVDTILTKGLDGNIYNIGSKNEFSVMEIASKLIRILKSSEDIDEHIEFVEDRNFNDFRYSISNDKLIQLGWTECVPFEEGLKDTVDWYLKNYKGHWN